MKPSMPIDTQRARYESIAEHFLKERAISKVTHSSGVLLGLPTLLHFFLSLGMVIDSL